VFCTTMQVHCRGGGAIECEVTVLPWRKVLMLRGTSLPEEIGGRQHGGALPLRQEVSVFGEIIAVMLRVAVRVADIEGANVTWNVARRANHRRGGLQR